MKFFKLEKIETDNLIFRLHYKVTFPVFILFSAMLTGNQYFGNPIDCLTQAGVSQSLMNTYCWTHGTYTVKRFEHVTRRPYGDWFLLRQMAKNVEAETFDHFLTALGKDEDFKAQANYKTLPMKMLGRGF